MAARKPAKDTPPKPETATEEVAPEVPNAIVVTKTTDENGVLQLDITPTGNVQPTEIQTLLELAIVKWRNMIGLGQKTG